MNNNLEFLNSTSTEQYNLIKQGAGSKNVIQSVDEAHGSLYSFHVSGDVAIINKYNPDGSNSLTSTRFTHSAYAEIGHQGLSYEKTITKSGVDANGNNYEWDVDVFWSSKHDDADSVVRFEVWDDPSRSDNLLVGNIQSYKVWPESGSKGSASPTISSDNKYLIVEDSNNNSAFIRVYYLDELSETGGDYSTSEDALKIEFELSPDLDNEVNGEKNPLQALASDGEYIYIITGFGGVNDPKKIAKYDLETGNEIGISDFEIGSDAAGNHLEPEGLFFTEDGQLAVSVATGPSGARVNTVYYVGDTVGTDDNDVINGDYRDNDIFGFTGDDTLIGSSGGDNLDGGDGIDTASYASANTRVNLDLRASMGSAGDASGDTFTSIENIIGSDYDDYVYGDAEDNILDGGIGTDSLRGDGGNDTLIGGSGDDDLRGGSGADTIYGGAGGDSVFGGSGGDYIELGAGDDYVRVGGGVESFYGGAGKDYISYYDSTDGVTLNLETNAVSGSWAVNDTIEGFESAAGSNTGDDHITGTNGANTIRTYGGDDTLIGGAGADNLDGGDGIDTIYGGSGDDRLLGGDGDDRLYGHSGNDTLDGGNGNDYLRGYSGNVTYYGGDGIDAISYWSSVGGVTIDLQNNIASGGDADGDVFTSIENIYGSNIADDRLYGDQGNNRISGGAGADSIYGRSGDDLIYGGAGSDRFDGGNGTDVIYGGAGADVFHFDKNEDHDIIKDFENNVDTVELDNFVFDA